MASCELGTVPIPRCWSSPAWLEDQGLVEALEADHRRRPYRLTSAGSAVLRHRLEEARTVAHVGLARLSGELP